MNIRNNVTEIKLDNTSYKMKFDFETIARIQAELKKNGIPYKFFEIFEGLENQDFSIIVPLFVHCIQRMHPQIKAETIKVHMTFDNLEVILNSLMELIENSMPKNTEADKKK